MPSQPIIKALQQRLEGLPEITPWASPEYIHHLAQLIETPKETSIDSSMKPPLKEGTNEAFSKLYTRILDNNEIPHKCRGETTPQQFVHPLAYLHHTPAGIELSEWLTNSEESPANRMIEFIEDTHRANPSRTDIGVKIQSHPIHAWVALREPIIARLIKTQSFDKLYQRQQQILTRLGFIWTSSITDTSCPQPPPVTSFIQKLRQHTQSMRYGPTFTIKQTGYLAEICFQYEIILWFCIPHLTTLKQHPTFENQRPIAKLTRLLATYSTKETK